MLDFAAVYKVRVAKATLYSVLGKIFDIAPPVLIGVAVDIVVQRQDSLLGRLGIRDLNDQLIVLGVLTLLIWIFESLFEYIQRVCWRNLAQSLQHDLRVDTYDHVQHLELAYFEDQSTGGLMSILNDDINQLERFLDVGANDVVQVLTTVLVIGGIFFLVAPSVAWMAAIPIPIIIWGSMKFQKAVGAEIRRCARTSKHDQSSSRQ